MTVIFAGVAADGSGFVIGDDRSTKNGKHTLCEKVLLIGERFAVATFGEGTPSTAVEVLCAFRPGQELQGGVPVRAPNDVGDLVEQIIAVMDPLRRYYWPYHQKAGGAQLADARGGQTGNLVILDCVDRSLHHCHLGALFPYPGAIAPVTRRLRAGTLYRFGIPEGKESAVVRGALPEGDPWDWGRAAVAEAARLGRSMKDDSIGDLGGGVVLRAGKPVARSAFPSPAASVAGFYGI